MADDDDGGYGGGGMDDMDEEVEEEDEEVEEEEEEEAEDGIALREDTAGDSKAIPVSQHTTTKYMTKYEKARVLGTRALQIRYHPTQRLRAGGPCGKQRGEVMCVHIHARSQSPPSPPTPYSPSPPSRRLLLNGHTRCCAPLGRIATC
jgi:hypothetical protein